MQQLSFKNLTSEEAEDLIKQNNLTLTVEEARKVEEEILGRPMTLAEATAWSIQGSEHCSYKSSRAYLSQLPTSGPNVILGPEEDAGIVELVNYKGERYGIIMGHESHNHPSQIVPYEGAATGVGGIVRDVACMGGRVIALADPLRFGEIKNQKTKWITGGVVSGISGYGNPIGVPNLTGDVYFNSSFNENCLVNVVALGLVKESEIIHSRAPKNAHNYDIILVGKPTDNSGFGGASFASFDLEEDAKEKNKGAVQEPNAFLKRHLLAATYDLFKVLKEKKLLDKIGFKDVGGGGMLCASVELVDAAGYGAEIDLAKVHVSMENLAPHIILCAETQERFVWIAHPKVSRLILDHYNQKWDLPKVSAGAKASLIGKVKEGGQYIVNYKGEKNVINARACDITKGLRYNRALKEPKKNKAKINFLEPKDYNKILLQILAHENIASREPIYERYDKSVQGLSVIEPGQADAGVSKPLIDEDLPEDLKKTGIALSVGANPIYSRIDPYWGAVNAVVEAMRNVAAVGAEPQALTDCLNYGNPEKEEEMWAFSQGVRGVADACHNIHLKKYKKNPTPIISGNVSLYNNSARGSVDPSPIIACLGKIKDYTKALTMFFKEAESSIVLVGDRQNELGGSIFEQIQNPKLYNNKINSQFLVNANLPKPKFSEAEAQIFAITDIFEKKLALACHDISDGGLAVALAEMVFGEEEKIGCEINLDFIQNKKLSPAQKLFSETGGFVLETKDLKSAEKICREYKIDFQVIGKTNNTREFKILAKNEKIISLKVSKMRKKWLNGLREKLK